MSRSVNGSACIVTGASGGLGAALAVAAAESGAAVVLVGRNSEGLRAVGARCESLGAAAVTLVAADLGSKAGVDRVCVCLEGGVLAGCCKVTLFNNASTIDPIESFANLSFDDMQRALCVNVAAAVVLAGKVIRLSQDMGIGEVSVVNISSGVSINAVKGWSAYCISKAALNMVTKCIAAETAPVPPLIYTLAINPGPLDTRMQVRIRNADRNKSPAVERFSKMYSEGKLKNPEDVAVKIFEILGKKTFATGEFVDFNQVR